MPPAPQATPADSYGYQPAPPPGARITGVAPASYLHPIPQGIQGQPAPYQGAIVEPGLRR
jgi:hypothetical protein